MQITIHGLKTDASKCRDLATTAITDEARQVLTELAVRYEVAARTLEQVRPKSRSSRPAFKWQLDAR